MYYVSTRDASLRYTAAQAIVQGLSREGGLFLPSEIPQLSREDLTELTRCSYPERAAHIMGLYLDDFSQEELLGFAEKAYGPAKFDTPAAAPVVKTEDGVYVMELWHGPTCAFKDMALQILPYLLTASLKKCGEQRQVCILVATSGDTGKAALQGFADVPGTKILVFYPYSGVSEIQRLQMATQAGDNVAVSAVRGNFDDAQTGVKKIFSDDAFAAKLAARHVKLSSANSINIGRLVPQVAYYVYSYLKLAADGVLACGQPMNVVVPTGNFGNILAAYFAREMGVPIAKLICASNDNKVLTDFIRSGAYDIRGEVRKFYCTNSPSMDILISSNLERLLYLLSGRDGARIRDWMNGLDKDKVYEVNEKVRAGLGDFYGGYCTQEETLATIGRMWRENHYLMDTHTAVAYKVYEDYRKESGDETPTVIASTASAYKFAESVASAIGIGPCADGFAYVAALAKETDVPVPYGLAGLDQKPVRHTGVVDAAAMPEAVLEALK